MDVIERAARVTQLAELAKDLRAARDELSQIDKHESAQAAQRHRALTDQVKLMVATQVQMRAALED
jgi:hypothetical protein